MANGFGSARKVRWLVGGRKDDARIDGVPQRANRYIPNALDRLPGWALVGLYSTVPLFVSVLAYILIIAPLSAAERMKNNHASGGFGAEYYRAILGWNYRIHLVCKDATKQVRISGLDMSDVRSRAEHAFPDCRAKSIVKICSSSRRDWLASIICTPERYDDAQSSR